MDALCKQHALRLPDVCHVWDAEPAVAAEFELEQRRGSVFDFDVAPGEDVRDAMVAAFSNHTP